MADLQKSIDNVSKNKGTIADVLNELLVDAYEQKASDIHLEPKENKTMLIRYRIDGMLHDINQLDATLQESLIFIIKVSSKLRTDEHFAPQDGKITFSITEKQKDQKTEKEVDVQRKIDARISILPVTHGEKAVIRLLAHDTQTLTLRDLGFSLKDLAIVENGYKNSYGTIIAAGPTGSGKTTTLYAIIKTLNSRDVNITTIEDPVEYDVDGVNHIQVNVKANLTFASGLRSILRQDPNIIMVGEIRDSETAKIAINAAMTGHLVLSTLHANDAATTIPRMLEMGVEPFLLASTVNVVIAQRLARRLCQNCKKESKIDKLQLDFLKKARPDVADTLKVGDIIYKKVGCEKCRNTGYKGRVGLYEVLNFTKKFREGIISRKSADELIDIAKSEGFTLMIEDGLEKLKEGVLDIDELIKVVAMHE